MRLPLFLTLLVLLAAVAQAVPVPGCGGGGGRRGNRALNCGHWQDEAEPPQQKWHQKAQGHLTNAWATHGSKVMDMAKSKIPGMGGGTGSGAAPGGSGDSHGAGNGADHAGQRRRSLADDQFASPLFARSADLEAANPIQLQARTEGTAHRLVARQDQGDTMFGNMFDENPQTHSPSHSPQPSRGEHTPSQSPRPSRGEPQTKPKWHQRLAQSLKNMAGSAKDTHAKYYGQMKDKYSNWRGSRSGAADNASSTHGQYRRDVFNGDNGETESLSVYKRDHHEHGHSDGESHRHHEHGHHEHGHHGHGHHEHGHEHGHHEHGHGTSGSHDSSADSSAATGGTGHSSGSEMMRRSWQDLVARQTHNGGMMGSMFDESGGGGVGQQRSPEDQQQLADSRSSRRAAKKQAKVAAARRQRRQRRKAAKAQRQAQGGYYGGQDDYY